MVTLETSGYSTPTAAFDDERGAVIAYGKALLSAVRDAEPQPARLHALVDQLQMPIDAALTVVGALEDQGYLTVVDRDLKGNHAHGAALDLADRGGDLRRYCRCLFRSRTCPRRRSARSPR